MKRRGFFGAFAGLIAAPAAAAMVSVTKQVEGALPVADKPEVAEMYAGGDYMSCCTVGTVGDFSDDRGNSWDDDEDDEDDMEDER